MSWIGLETEFFFVFVFFSSFRILVGQVHGQWVCVCCECVSESKCDTHSRKVFHFPKAKIFAIAHRFCDWRDRCVIGVALLGTLGVSKCLMSGWKPFEVFWLKINSFESTVNHTDDHLITATQRKVVCFQNDNGRLEAISAINDKEVASYDLLTRESWSGPCNLRFRVYGAAANTGICKRHRWSSDAQHRNSLWQISSSHNEPMWIDW